MNGIFIKRCSRDWKVHEIFENYIDDVQETTSILQELLIYINTSIISDKEIQTRIIMNLDTNF